MTKATILGTGSYRPERIVTNFDLEKIVETNDEWIQSRTGIETRHVSTGENTSDLAYEAAIKALESSKLSPEELDLIIVATITPDHFMPSTACLLQKRLGAKNATAFDLSAACSGLVFGIDVGTQFIESGRHKHILVVGSEVMSKAVNWQDRNTCVLFGDGAGAVILGPSKNDRGIKAIYTGSDGDVENYLALTARPVDNFLNKEEEKKHYLTMDGQEIFKFAVRIMRKGLKEVVSRAGKTLDDVSYIVPHQANSRIIDLVATKMKFSSDKFYLNLKNVGNTSSASIGLALDELMHSGKLEHGQDIVLMGFGGGLTWGVIYIEY
ncbi:MAG: ketoacyl-ACP synthase III [Tissierellales bacterium]|nr:ketoacyl-ACP synthase III [Tissierellales bacterium]